jgi:hypothetical protein
MIEREVMPDADPDVIMQMVCTVMPGYAVVCMDGRKVRWAIVAGDDYRRIYTLEEAEAQRLRTLEFEARQRQSRDQGR